MVVDNAENPWQNMMEFRFGCYWNNILLFKIDKMKIMRASYLMRDLTILLLTLKVIGVDRTKLVSCQSIYLKIMFSLQRPDTSNKNGTPYEYTYVLCIPYDACMRNLVLMLWMFPCRELREATVQEVNQEFFAWAAPHHS